MTALRAVRLSVCEALEVFRLLHAVAVGDIHSHFGQVIDLTHTRFDAANVSIINIHCIGESPFFFR